MNTTKKPLSKTRIEITIKLDAEDLSAAEAKALSRLANSLKIPGFRKGKAPLPEAKKHIASNDIASAALDIAVRTAIPGAFADTEVISMPEVSVDKYVPGQVLEFRASADILPEIKLGNYKALKVKKPDHTPDAKSVDEVLNNIATSLADKKVASRPAQLGDEVQIDFTGYKDSKPFDGGSAKDFKLTLGSHQFIPGFEDGIVGHSTGDKFSLDLSFPADYHATQLAGAKFTFEVLLKQVNEVTPAELTDELAQKVGPFKTLAELRADIEKNLSAQSERRATEQYKDALVAELVRTSTVAAPETLIADQLRMITLDLEQNLKANATSKEQYLAQIGQTKEQFDEKSRKTAELRVQSALVLQALARELDISATETETDAKLTELREIYKKDPTATKNLSDPRITADVRNRLTIEKTLARLVELNTKH